MGKTQGRHARTQSPSTPHLQHQYASRGRNSTVNPTTTSSSKPRGRRWQEYLSRETFVPKSRLCPLCSLLDDVLLNHDQSIDQCYRAPSSFSFLLTFGGEISPTAGPQRHGLILKRKRFWTESRRRTGVVVSGGSVRGCLGSFSIAFLCGGGRAVTWVSGSGRELGGGRVGNERL